MARDNRTLGAGLKWPISASIACDRPASNARRKGVSHGQPGEGRPREEQAETVEG
jgi:hypothetical protein